MRENMKQQMRDMLSTLGRAEAILDSRTKKRETEEIARLLEDMQASAMAIGTAIEQVEGDGTQTVRLLEDYCELLWQYMVEEDLKAEFEVRLEIVFLVCRSRAWKQMERFYHLMKDKADCYVLTASYKEEDASGEEAVMHDESALIPESVKPFGFGQYDIRERKPDMVFTDGPYACPGQGGIFYEDEELAEEDHCRIPQALYSDIILVPSGKVNEIYVNAMSRLDNGRDMIKKIYVLDGPDGYGALADVWKEKR